ENGQWQGATAGGTLAGPGPLAALPQQTSRRISQAAARATCASEVLGNRPSKEALARLVETGEGRDALARILRKAKANRVGTAIADLTICGAIPPYNEVLGGKLLAMLMMSPEVVAEYRRRYASVPSVIASSMAGRPVVRPADLAFID